MNKIRLSFLFVVMVINIITFQNCEKYKLSSHASELSSKNEQVILEKSENNKDIVSLMDSAIIDSVFHYPMSRPTETTNPHMWIRHLGNQFLNNKVSVSSIESYTGIKAPVIGATRSDLAFGVPTFLQRNGSEYGMYFNTKELNQTTITMEFPPIGNLPAETVNSPLIPFNTRYCKAVGLGAPQFTVGHNVSSKSIHPWKSQDSFLEFKVDVKVPISVISGNLPPVFISSFYIYISDVSNPGSTIAFLANIFDYRGQPEGAIGHDNHVYFMSTPLGNVPLYTSGEPKIYWTKDLYDTIGEPIQKDSFTEYKKFGIRINKIQLLNIIKVFKSSLGTKIQLSEDVKNYQLGAYGLLNEMNYHYQSPASECVANFDTNSYAQTGLAFRNFEVLVSKSSYDEDYKGGFEGFIDDKTLSGWACKKGNPTSQQVQIYTNQQAVASIKADLVAEPAVYKDQCQSGSVYHRFKYVLSDEQKLNLGGQTFFADIYEGQNSKHTLRKYPGLTYIAPRVLPEVPTQRERLELKRYYWINKNFSPVYWGHRITTKEPESFYSLETVLGTIYKNKQSNSLALYECLSGNVPNHYFLSIADHCFGAQNKGLVGFISQVREKGQKDIYLCYTTGIVNGKNEPLSHFVSLSPTCEGFNRDGHLGFID